MYTYREREAKPVRGCYRWVLVVLGVILVSNKLDF